MARLFAKALNCEEGVGHQCNECENCRQLNEGSHPDVIEIDAASNNGVDQVRDLIVQWGYTHYAGGVVKVYAEFCNQIRFALSHHGYPLILQILDHSDHALASILQVVPEEFFLKSLSVIIWTSSMM